MRIYCPGVHYPDKCSEFPTVEARKKALGNFSCYLCLRRGHTISSCPSKDERWCVCFYCKQPNVHHRSLCVVRNKVPWNQSLINLQFNRINPILNNQIPIQMSQSTVSQIFYPLQTNAMAMSLLKVMLHNPVTNLCVEVNALLDSGSKRTVHTFWTVWSND